MTSSGYYSQRKLTQLPSPLPGPAFRRWPIRTEKRVHSATDYRKTITNIRSCIIYYITYSVTFLLIFISEPERVTSGPASYQQCAADGARVGFSATFFAGFQTGSRAETSRIGSDSARSDSPPLEPIIRARTPLPSDPSEPVGFRERSPASAGRGRGRARPHRPRREPESDRSTASHGRYEASRERSLAFV